MAFVEFSLRGVIGSIQGATGSTAFPVGLAFGLAFVSYLLGSVPFGLLFGKMRGVDIRRVGSGNIGATNVGRALGRPWALAAFLCDFAKGWVPSALFAPAALRIAGGGDHRLPALAVVAGGAAVAGHVWPIYLRFRGGKGVATGCGALVGIDPVLFLVGGLVWLLTLALARMVGLASLAMGLSFPLAAWWRMDASDSFLHGRVVVLGAGLLTLLVFVRHRANMARMLAGTEPRIGAGKKRSESEEDD
ncbi:MAG TPA: glycerol-3-phosphate 1-O-acyltransferase [Planctomycetes bacterium]|nr:glycerol-3-phosphate 1-O-acyltransferase [Planctomycetota bacterium]